MNIVCSIAGHAQAPKTVWNAGRHFSRCVRCNVDLVEQSGKWAPAPRGFGIVWRHRIEAGESLPIAPGVESPVAPAFDPEATINPPLFELTQDLIATPSERRTGTERRTAVGALPSHLAGRDRRLLRRDQRKGFGRKANAA